MKKSNLKKSEVKYFTKLLKLERKSTKKELKTLNNLVNDQKEFIKNSDVTYDSDASKVRNREMLKNMRRRTRAKLKDYDNALKKIENGTYGICDRTGKKTSKQRLMAMPEATTCVSKIR